MVDSMKDFQIELDEQRIYRTLGYSNGHRPKPSLRSLVDAELAEAHELVHTSCSYQIMDIKRIRRPRVTLVNGTDITLTSEVLSWALYPCEQAVIFVASIGGALEQRVAQLMAEGHSGKAVILDAIGSEATEKTVCYLQAQIREVAKLDDGETTLRYSPGYCDWDIDQQRVLFKAMHSIPMQVSLSDECVMTPRKSVSGIIGLGWSEKPRLRLSPCRFCTRQDCKNRR
jgi:hypothetical protein